MLGIGVIVKWLWVVVDVSGNELIGVCLVCYVLLIYDYWFIDGVDVGCFFIMIKYCFEEGVFEVDLGL